ncbi:MAG: SGNH/GDSL hydrolase family protein [bacterium]|nr:SGNH/GDSL hydrolase family protein [bacterium]
MVKDITVLFQGDSITDAGRNRNESDSLGFGYVLFAASWFHASHPEKPVRFLNRGISGNRIKDLQARWKQDCLDLTPDIVSILIGINDTWRRYDQNDPTTAEQFEVKYRDILNQTSQCGAKIVLCEPFILHISEDRIRYREDLNPKIAVVHKLAEEFNAILVPFDKIFQQVSSVRPPSFWAVDGVHPTPVGHALMAQYWLQKVEPLLLFNSVS